MKKPESIILIENTTNNLKEGFATPIPHGGWKEIKILEIKEDISSLRIFFKDYKGNCKGHPVCKNETYIIEGIPFFYFTYDLISEECIIDIEFLT